MKTPFLRWLRCSDGQTSVDYLLVVAALVLGLAGLLWSPALKNAVSQFYKHASIRILKPGK